MTTITPKIKFRFVSSYRGQHDYMACFTDGSERRISVRVALEDYFEECTMTPSNFESWVNDRLGYLTGCDEILTENLVVEFNRQTYQKWRSEVDQIIANPGRYGEWDARKFNVNVGARFCRDTRKWIPLQTFESVCDLAGIPADFCSDPRLAFISQSTSL